MATEKQLRRGQWTLEEDLLLANCISIHGEGRWNLLSQRAGMFNFLAFSIYLLKSGGFPTGDRCSPSSSSSSSPVTPFIPKKRLELELEEHALVHFFSFF